MLSVVYEIYAVFQRIRKHLKELRKLRQRDSRKSQSADKEESEFHFNSLTFSVISISIISARKIIFLKSLAINVCSIGVFFSVALYCLLEYFL